MKAIIWSKYGPPKHLAYKEVERPILKDDEVLIKVYATTAMPGDCEIRRFDMHVLFWLPLRLYFGLFKPKRPILGMELAGEIVGLGREVKTLKVGDAVIAGAGLRMGAYGQFVCLPAKNNITLKPEKLSYEQVASLSTAGINALHYIREAKLQPGQSILINGAAGCFGTYAIQLAKLQGTEVTGVDSTTKIDKLIEIGADFAIDYTKEDFTKNEKKYDVIFDLRGTRSVRKLLSSLKSGGKYILATPWVFQVLKGLVLSLFSDKKFIFSLAAEKKEDLDYLKNLMAEGKIKPIIGKTFPLEEMVAAHEYVESGDKIGNVIISVPHE